MARKFGRGVTAKAHSPSAFVRDQMDRVSTGDQLHFATPLLLPKRCIIYCGAGGLIGAELSELCEREEARLLVWPEGVLPEIWLALHTDEIDVLMVDGDHLGDIEDTIDFCMRVRRACPSLPLILVSSEMRGDDLTCERMQACDVTLKVPVSQIRLEGAIQAARQNNAYFLSRRHWENS